MTGNKYSPATALADTEISNWALNILRAEGVQVLGDLVSWEPGDLMDLRNFGPKCLRDVEKALAEAGLALKKVDYKVRR